MSVRLLVLIGLPGSGKSTWAARQALNAISSDEMRRLLTDDPADQTIHGRAFAAVRYFVRQRLQLARPVTCVDATNLTRGDRAPFIRLANSFDAEAEAIFFLTPLQECLRRNALRTRVVPPEAIQLMAAKLQIPELGEGFARLSLIRPGEY